MVVATAGETASLTREFVGETNRVQEHTQTYPPGNQHQKGPICLWVAGKVTESLWRAGQAALFPLGPSPTYSSTSQPRAFPCPGKYLRLGPLLRNIHAETKNTDQMKEQIKTPEKNTAKQ